MNSGEQFGSLVEDVAWRLRLWTYAHRLSEGKWKPYRWAKYVANEVQKAIMRGNGRVIINGPVAVDMKKVKARKDIARAVGISPDQFRKIFCGKLRELGASSSAPGAK